MDNSPDKESQDAPTQLRALADDKVASTYAYGRDLRRAANEIERLRTALQPFAAAVYNDNGDVTLCQSQVTRADWMRAAAAIKEPK